MFNQIKYYFLCCRLFVKGLYGVWWCIILMVHSRTRSTRYYSKFNPKRTVPSPVEAIVFFSSRPTINRADYLEAALGLLGPF